MGNESGYAKIPPNPVVANFREIKGVDKHKIVEWLNKTFRQSKHKQNLINFLNQDHILLKKKFYSHAEGYVVFYFVYYSTRTKRRGTKHISFRLCEKSA